MTEPESLQDTIRAVSSYFDLIVLRHSAADALDQVASLSSVPVINAGNGSEEHPTQAIIDLFTVRNWHHRLEGLRVGIVGNLRDSRAAHSFAKAISLFQPKELRLMAPRGRELPAWVLTGMSSPATSYEDGIHPEDLDVLYMSGLPEGDGRERLRKDERAKFALAPLSARALSPNAAVLCPLPRIDEIDTDFDGQPNARYFAQSADGLFVRMAIIHHILQSTNA